MAKALRVNHELIINFAINGLKLRQLGTDEEDQGLTGMMDLTPTSEGS